MSTLDLSVVIAANNEEAIIRQTVTRLVEWLAANTKGRWELVICDDGSSDRTGTILDEIAASEPKLTVLHHRRNFGQGRALRTAFDLCRGAVIVTLDADLSYGPEYINLLIEALDREQADIALASPYAKGGRVANVPTYRWLLSKWGNLYLATMSDYDVSTITCVVRAYRAEVIDTLLLTADGMELQLEILQKSQMNRYRVCEIPAHLEWAVQKADDARLLRVSKMRILRTIRTYLLFGWLSRPALLFMAMGLLMVVPGLYMAGRLVARAFGMVISQTDQGMVEAISSGLKLLFEQYSYSVVISGLLLAVGLQFVGFGLLVVQNKFYFEQVYRLIQDAGLHRLRDRL